MSDGISRVLKRVEELQGRIRQILRPPSPTAEKTKAQEPTFAAAMDRANGNAPKPVPEELRGLFAATARKYQLDQRLLEAVARHESAFQPDAVSPKGAQGLMQIMPGTQKLLGVTAPYDARDSLDGGAKYLRQMLDRFGGNRELALAAYNAGPEAVERYQGVPPFAETGEYVRRIIQDLGGGPDSGEE